MALFFPWLSFRSRPRSSLISSAQMTPWTWYTAIPKNLVPRVFDAPQKSEKDEKSRKITKNHGKEKKT